MALLSESFEPSPIVATMSEMQDIFATWIDLSTVFIENRV